MESFRKPKTAFDLICSLSVRPPRRRPYLRARNTCPICRYALLLLRRPPFGSAAVVSLHFDVAGETRFSRSLQPPQFVRRSSVMDSDSCAAHLLPPSLPVFPSWTRRHDAAPLKDAKEGGDRRNLAILTLFGVLSNKLGRPTGVHSGTSTRNLMIRLPELQSKETHEC